MNSGDCAYEMFNACAGRQGPSDLGALQTTRGRRLLYASNARIWLAEIPDIAEQDLKLMLDPDNLTEEWIELRHWFEDRKTSAVAAPLVQLVAHIEAQGATPFLRPVDVRYPFQHVIARMRIGRCLIVRDTGSMADWLAACHEHGATALGVVLGPGEGPSGAANASLRIAGASRYNTRSRLAIVDFANAANCAREDVAYVVTASQSRTGEREFALSDRARSQAPRAIMGSDRNCPIERP